MSTLKSQLLIRFFIQRDLSLWQLFFSPDYPPSKLRIQVGLQLSVTFQGIFQFDNLSHFRSSFSFSFWVSFTSPCSLILGLVWVCFGSYLFSLIIWVCFESISSLILVSFDSPLTLFWVLWVYLESQLSLFWVSLSLFWVSYVSLLSLFWVSFESPLSLSSFSMSRFSHFFSLSSLFCPFWGRLWVFSTFI